eukprot:scaffold268108_cov16-Prasinocladus_malaysianus.AAC.1
MIININDGTITKIINKANITAVPTSALINASKIVNSETTSTTTATKRQHLINKPDNEVAELDGEA